MFALLSTLSFNQEAFIRHALCATHHGDTWEHIDGQWMVPLRLPDFFSDE